MDSSFEGCLSRVQGPGQYVGGEPNQVVKPDALLRLALAFPDVYSVGMSHHGSRILYSLANAQDGVAAERVFAPFPDMETELRAAGQPLSTLETRTPLHACDLVGFSLSHELAATTVPNMLDLGGIPVTRFERKGTTAPLVIAGGHAAVNPEPWSDFMDLFVIGEAEEAWLEIIAILLAAKRDGGKSTRDELLSEMAKRIAGVYVPEFYETVAAVDGTVFVVGPKGGNVPFPVRRRVFSGFASSSDPVKPIVPIHETAHERVVLEIMRGCPNGCRFCQAGFITRPLRERPPESLLAAARDAAVNTGYDEIGLLSLSSSNYSRFDELVANMDAEFAPCGVSLSLPSLRVNRSLLDIPNRFKTVRKSGLTIAPEAATARLRAVINKDVVDEDLFAAVGEAFRSGWRSVKMYFMVGLPTETDEDVQAIAELSSRVAGLGRRSGSINLSVSNFVPKPHTPFQWLGADKPGEWSRKHGLIRTGLERRRVDFRSHDTNSSLLEAALSRGDRRLGKVILAAWKKGARLDGWTEHFRPDIWNDAWKEAGLDPVAYACRTIDQSEMLPWSHIDSGMDTAFLKRELERSLSGATTPMCAMGSCAGCGVAGCSFIGC